MRSRRSRITILLIAALGSVGCGSPARSGDRTVAGDATAGDDAVVDAVADTELFPEGACGGFEGLSLADEVPLLADHLRIRPLEGAADQARPHSIMAAPPPNEGETRLYLEDGGRKLVVFTAELYHRPTADLAAGVRHVDPPAPTDRLVPLELPSGLRAAAIVATRLDTSTEAVPVLRLYVVSPDDTVQLVAFYVSPEVAAEGRGCARLARRIAETLRPGERRIDASGGEHVLEGTIGLTLPPGYVVLPQPGPDFAVYRVYPLVPLDEPTGSLGIYLGQHPSAAPVAPGTGTPGTVFGQPMEWRDRVEGILHARDAVLDVPGHGGLVAHVFVNAPDEAARDALTAVAATLRAGPRP